MRYEISGRGIIDRVDLAFSGDNIQESARLRVTVSASSTDLGRSLLCVRNQVRTGDQP